MEMKTFGEGINFMTKRGKTRDKTAKEPPISVNEEGSKPIPKLLPLKSDLIFKLVFGDPRYIEIVQAFLTAALDIPAEEYEGLQIIDPHLERDSPDHKLGILDVRIRLTNKKIVSVEIQVRQTPFMPERVAFSTGRNLSRQIAPGESYEQIAKVVTIVITDYDMIRADQHYHHVFRLYDEEKRVQLTDVMEIHTLELRKVPNTSGADSNSKEKELLNWLRLIRSEREEEIEMLSAETVEMEMAAGRLKRLSADERTRMLYEARELYLMDEMARINAAQAKGKLEGKLEVAHTMLAKDMPLEFTAEITGLSVEELKKLRRL
jgi:predicted transposase/invertase (TIGR01784 family)